MPNVTKNAPVSRHFCSRKRFTYFRRFSCPHSHSLAGILAKICPHTFDLCGIFRHRFLRGLQHVIAIVRDRLAERPCLVLGGGDDLRSTLLGAFLTISASLTRMRARSSAFSRCSAPVRLPIR